MSPLSVAMVTSKRGVGIDLEGGGGRHGDLRYPSCLNPSTPVSDVSCATSSRSSAPTPPPCARAGPRRPGCPPRRAGARPAGGAGDHPRAAASRRLLERLTDEGQGQGLRHARRAGAQRSAARPVRRPGPPHAASTSTSTSSTTRTCAGPTAWAAHRPPRAPGRAVEPAPPRGAPDAAQGERRPGAPGPARRRRRSSSARVRRSRSTGDPVELVLYLQGRRDQAEVDDHRRPPRDRGVGHRISRDLATSNHPFCAQPRPTCGRGCAQKQRGGSAGDEDASFSQAGEALPEHREEDVGGPLEAAVAVVDPVLGAGLQQAHDALRDQAGRRLVGPGAGDPLDARPAGRLDGGVLQRRRRRP